MFGMFQIGAIGTSLGSEGSVLKSALSGFRTFADLPTFGDGGSLNGGGVGGPTLNILA